MRVDDARRAVDIGATAISVSNHGGNNLDGTPATIRALPADRRGRGRRDRGADRRRHPPGRRRGEGGGPRRPGRDDRPGLPVGPGGQRAGRGGERPRHPPQRDRLGPPGPRPRLGQRAGPRPTSSSRPALPAASALAPSRSVDGADLDSMPDVARGGGGRRRVHPRRAARFHRAARPHLPLGTDSAVAVALAEPARRGAGPTSSSPRALPYGSAGEHAAFPGTLSIGAAALELVIVELVRSADAFAGVVLVSGHGGNAAPLAAAVATLRAEGRRVLAWSPRISGGDAHAGRTETSLLLALAPEAVRLDAAERRRPPPAGGGDGRPPPRRCRRRVAATGCWATRPAPPPKKAGASSTSSPPTSSPRSGPGGRDRGAAPPAGRRVATRHRRRPGHRSRHRPAPRRGRVAARALRPVRRRPGAQLSAGHPGRPGEGRGAMRRAGDRARPFVGDVRDQAALDAAVALAEDDVRRARRRGGGGRLHRRRAAGLGDPRRPVGDHGRRQPGGRVAPGPRRRSGAAAPGLGPVRGHLLGRRCARPPPPGGLHAPPSTA